MKESIEIKIHMHPTLTVLTKVQLKIIQCIKLKLFLTQTQLCNWSYVSQFNTLLFSLDPVKLTLNG